MVLPLALHSNRQTPIEEADHLPKRQGFYGYALFFCLEAIVVNGFINDENMKYLENLSDEDKKWVLLFLCFLLAGEDGTKKIVETIEKDKENKN